LELEVIMRRSLRFTFIIILTLVYLYLVNAQSLATNPPIQETVIAQLGGIRRSPESNSPGNPTETESPTKVKRPPSDGRVKSGKSYGDPHIITFDGYRYSFQMVGEFTLVTSKDKKFEVQVRQGAVPKQQLSLNTGVAMKVGNDRVALYTKEFPDSETDTPLRINGKPTKVEDSLSLGGGKITHSGSDYIVQWNTGEKVKIRDITVANNQFMNVIPEVPVLSDWYIGLLGNLNGKADDDLRSRDGNIVPTKNNSTYGQLNSLLNKSIPIPGVLNQAETLFFDQLYKEFGNSWRIKQSESLFDYPQDKNTESFTKLNFPSSYTALSSFLPPQLRKANDICRRAGVEADLLEGCIFDVANTGESGFAQAAVDILTDEVKKRVEDEVKKRIPIRIPGFPF